MTPLRRWLPIVLGGVLVALYLAPLVALALSVRPGDLLDGLRAPAARDALWLSLHTSAAAMLATVAFGLPLAAYLARSDTWPARLLSALVDVPIALPPAVVGVALLTAFGRSGLFGPVLEAAGISVPFSPAAVVLAQVLVASPFFVRAAARALAAVPESLVDVARTLGASRAAAFARVTVPLAAPGLLAGLSLAWARALGEFGATLVFAGNLPGRTQTLPLAIVTALEADVRVAVALSLVATVAAVLLLGLFRATGAYLAERT